MIVPPGVFALSVERFFIVFVAVVHRRHGSDLLKDIPESLDIGVAHIIHHFIDSLTAGLQLPLGSLDLQSLHIFQHRIVRRPLEPSFESAAADGEFGG